MKTILVIFIGGGVGSISRYLLGKLIIDNFYSDFPLGTFIINVLGCFLIGVFLTLSEKYIGFSSEWKLFLATGFCGGFTTFSTFAFENYKLLNSNQLGLFFAYTGLSIAIGLMATWLGIVICKSIL